MPVHCSPNWAIKATWERSMRISPLNVDIILGPSIVGWKLILSISSNCVLTVINASAAVTLLEQRPEKIQDLFIIITYVNNTVITIVQKRTVLSMRHLHYNSYSTQNTVLALITLTVCTIYIKKVFFTLHWVTYRYADAQLTPLQV